MTILGAGEPTRAKVSYELAGRLYGNDEKAKKTLLDDIAKLEDAIVNPISPADNIGNCKRPLFDKSTRKFSNDLSIPISQTVFHNVWTVLRIVVEFSCISISYDYF